MTYASIIITVHDEDLRWIDRAIASAEKQRDAKNIEIVIVADKATDKVLKFLQERAENHTIVITQFGDLGLARNEGIGLASGKYCSILDGDDLYGDQWIAKCAEIAKTFNDDNFAIHPEYMVFFGAEAFMHRHFSDNDPLFDAKDMVQFNQWSALVFAPRSLFLKFPYAPVQGGFGFEDWQWNTTTLGAGVAHRVAPGSMHAIRKKAGGLARSSVDKRLLIPKMDLFDRRDLPNATAKQPTTSAIPKEIVEQSVRLHRDVGERKLIITPDMRIRMYPRARCWADQAWLRDQIGTAKHVVLMDEFVRGGAQKYGFDWAAAIAKAGGDVAIIETIPGESPWLKKAEASGAKVVRWEWQVKDLAEEEKHYALQRALLQCELDSVFVCNSRYGWGLVMQNAEALAKRVFCASFATIPAGNGFDVCPPFFLPEQMPENVRIVTDNESHAALLGQVGENWPIVVQPKCTYGGPSKRSQTNNKPKRILWAGRGTPEKNPGVLPAVAAILGDDYAIHVWGDVKPMNGPENLKLRGPFDGFGSIDGSYDLYLNTSTHEGMPNTMLEATLAGLPVVGPNIGGLTKMANTLFYSHDPKSIAEAIASCGNPVSGSAERLTRNLVMEWADNFDSLVAETVGLQSESKCVTNAA